MSDNRQISEFNESMLQIQRLHNHWLNFSTNIKQGNYKKANWELDDVEGELYWDAEKLDNEEETGYLNRLKVLNKKIEAGFNLGNLKIIYYLLRERQKLLKEIQQESGKGSKYKSADEDTLL